jgi:hypothetical protein
MARTGVETGDELEQRKKCDIPTREEAKKNVAPVLAALNVTLDRLEQLRQEALRKVTAALM